MARGRSSTTTPGEKDNNVEIAPTREPKKAKKNLLDRQGEFTSCKATGEQYVLNFAKKKPSTIVETCVEVFHIWLAQKVWVRHAFWSC